jgi:flagellar biosynthesis protein FlhG
MDAADQASRLRELVERSASAEPTGYRGAGTIAVTGGKGGVGKTNVTANLAIAIASMGRSVAILDADYALANVDVLLGFSPEFTIQHVLSGERSVGEIIVEGPGGVKIVPAASGMQELAQLNLQQQNQLFKALQVIEKHFQHLLIDTAAGMADNVMNILRSAANVVVVTNPEPPAFVDSYALIKHLISYQGETRISLVVNSVSSEAEAMGIYDRIATTLYRFQKAEIEFLGFVLEDESVRKAVRRQRPFVLQYPNCPASRCISTLARKLTDGGGPAARALSFWEKLMNVLGAKAAS